MYRSRGPYKTAPDIKKSIQLKPSSKGQINCFSTVINTRASSDLAGRDQNYCLIQFDSFWIGLALVNEPETR